MWECVMNSCVIWRGGIKEKFSRSKHDFICLLAPLGRWPPSGWPIHGQKSLLKGKGSGNNFCRRFEKCGNFQGFYTSCYQQPYLCIAFFRWRTGQIDSGIVQAMDGSILQFLVWSLYPFPANIFGIRGQSWGMVSSNSSDTIVNTTCLLYMFWRCSMLT